MGLGWFGGCKVGEQSDSCDDQTLVGAQGWQRLQRAPFS